MGEAVSSIYSSSTPDTITSDDINNEVRAFQGELKEDDRRLFNFAKHEITKEASKRNITNVTIYIEFKHREPLQIKKGNSEEQFILITEEEGVFILRWEKQWLARRICARFQDTTGDAVLKVKEMATTLFAIPYQLAQQR